MTALTHQAGIDTTEQAAKLYYYHADHLQSAQFITDANGEKYEHIEYTPYGELWIEETAPGVDKLPFRFTGKELDEETGLYYYGARYLDPKYSRWLSGDPAIGEYIPQAGADTSKLPNGGVYNSFNFAVFGYANNNPIKYNDPTGESSALAVAIPAAGKTVGAVAMSIGPIGWVAIGVTVVGVGVGIALYNHTKASAKAKEQAEDKLPSQGVVNGNVEGAPGVDAGKQGKHVPGHPNEQEGKSKWRDGETGVNETQEAWQNGVELQDGTKVWDSGKELGSDGQTGVRVHIDRKGNIHGYPVHPDQYLKER